MMTYTDRQTDRQKPLLLCSIDFNLLPIALHSKTKYNEALSIYSNLILFLYCDLTNYYIFSSTGYCGNGSWSSRRYGSASNGGYGSG